MSEKPMKKFLDSHKGNKIWLYNFILDELGVDLLSEIVNDKERLDLTNVALKIKQRILTECPEHYQSLRRELDDE